MREGIHHIGFSIFQFDKLFLQMFRSVPVCHRRDADGLRYLELDIVHVVELPGKLDVVNSDGGIFDRAESQPGLVLLTGPMLLHAASDRKEKKEKKS